LPEMLRCSSGLTRTMRGAPTMESAARNACRFLYDELIDLKNARACALVRCYKTHPYSDLPAELQRFARAQLSPRVVPSPDMRCLTLIGTAGDERDWNDRAASKGHQAIPMPSADAVSQAPMVAELIRAFGIDIEAAIAPTSDFVKDLQGKSYGVFHVRDARNSPHIPAQDFVQQHKVRSVIGFGGALKAGDLFAFICFAKVPVAPAGAERFRTIALHAKSSLFYYSADQVFDAPAAVV
jgi:hypothetical protein